MSNSWLLALGGSIRLCTLAAGPAILAEVGAWNRIDWNLTEITSRYSHCGCIAGALDVHRGRSNRRSAKT